MKYWTELSNLETELINLEQVVSLVNVINSGLEESDQSDIKNSLYLVQDALQKIQSNLNMDFQSLWSTIREDTMGLDDDEFDEETDDETAADEGESYDFRQVESAVNSWAKS